MLGPEQGNLGRRMQQGLGDITGLFNIDQMGVHIDQAWQDRIGRPVGQIGPGWRWCIGCDGNDPAIDDLDQPIALDLAFFRIDQKASPDITGLRVHGQG